MNKFVFIRNLTVMYLSYRWSLCLLSTHRITFAAFILGVTVMAALAWKYYSFLMAVRDIRAQIYGTYSIISFRTSEMQWFIRILGKASEKVLQRNFIIINFTWFISTALVGLKNSLERHLNIWCLYSFGFNHVQITPWTAYGYLLFSIGH